MASANLDLVRSIYAAWGRGDFSSTEWAHPEIEFVIADGPEAGSWTGVAGIEEAMRSILSAFDEFRGVAEEYHELDDERVLVLTRRTGRGKTSGLELGDVRTKAAQLFHVQGGKVTRFLSWWERERALADLGLAHEAGSPVSRENVEVVREVIKAFQEGMERGDPGPAIDSGLIAADFEWIPVREMPGPSSYRGYDGFAEFMRAWIEDFQGWSIHIERLIDAGDDRVVALVQQSATGKASGAPVDLHWGQIFELQQGRVIRIRNYLDPGEALAAAGLEE